MAKRKAPKFGQGINALLSNIDTQIEPEKQKEVVKELANSIATLPIDQIERNQDQPRKDFDQEGLEALAASIKTHGLIQPITVRRLNKNKYQLISGERRFRASKIAKLKEIPAYIRLANDQELMEMALVENIQRQDLNPIEVAATYQRLLDEFNLTHAQLSERVGKSRSVITNSLRLLKLPPEIYNGLKAGIITQGQAKPLAGLTDIIEQLRLYNRIVEEGLSARQVEEIVKALKAPKQKTSKPKTRLTPEFQHAQNSLSSFFEAKVNLKVDKTGKGKIVINFEDMEHLTALLDKLD